VGSATPRRFFLLSAHLAERIEPAQEGLQRAKLRGRWCPGEGLLGLHKAGEHLRVHRIGLLAKPQALGIGLGARRVDDAHRMPRVMQCAGQGFTVRPVASRHACTGSLAWVASHFRQALIPAGSLAKTLVLNLP